MRLGPTGLPAPLATGPRGARAPMREPARARKEQQIPDREM